ncbi:MAG: exodeoxyribonuclease VII large subunit [Clostridia bacterium]|jgi:exodeoxyribonuclease VII, large subunit|nr:exodeoxyribonuclease 7 large subunit [Clostridium sp. CAG:798]
MTYNAISVTELNKYIKDKFEEDEMLNNILVKGEISNFKHHYTGHMYFTLKDENSLIKCVMFKTYTPNLNFIPKDGMQVKVLGTVSVFERDGVYQIYCKAMQQDGLGDLYRIYTELKEKLSKEGLFDDKYKKPIPYMPKCIGVLTSNTGSVIRDIINVSTRRNPNVYIKLLPVPVQGQGAARKITEAIKIMNENRLCDVIILARGGGSLEDLWPFNEEIVARAIFDSKIPIVSAVGHETDFTISDFVADLRAPTPSAAAELVIPNVKDILLKLKEYESRQKIALNRKIQIMKLRYEKCLNSKVFKEPLQKINERYMMLDIKVRQMESYINQKYINEKAKAIKLIAKLDALSPLKTLSRGYSIITLNGKTIKEAKYLKKDDEINIKLFDGQVNAKILKKECEEE